MHNAKISEVDAVEVFKSLGHPARLAIVKALGSGELCVCDLVGVAGLSWPSVSRHLAVLRSAGVLEDEKRGMQVFYRMILPCVTGFIACLEGGDSGSDEHACLCGE